MQMLRLRAMENLWKKDVGHNFNGHSWPTLPEFKNALRHTAAPDWFCSEFHRFLCHSYFEEFEGENATPLDSEEFIDIVIFILCEDSQYHAKLLFSLLFVENGNVSTNNLESILKEAIASNGVIFDKEEIECMIDVLLKEFENQLDFNTFINEQPELCQALSFRLTQWLTIPITNENANLGLSLPKLSSYWKNQKSNTFFGSALLIFTVFIITWRVSNFWHLKNVDGQPAYLLMVARGSGVAINFFFALLILVMSRDLITSIRMTKLSFYLPVDHHVDYHKIFGILLFLLSAVHSAVHLYNIEKNFKEGNYELYLIANNLTVTEMKNLSFAEWLFTDQPKVNGLIEGWANPTGVLLLIFFLVIGVGAYPGIRKKGYFEIFYWTHLLYLPCMLIFILHSDQAIWWFGIPCAIFLVGKVKMIKRRIDGSGKSYVVCGTLLPSKVTQLTIRKAENFKFRCGDWVFVQIPSICYEWHPFTISSAPEQKDVFTLHIRSVGGWTNKLHSYFQKEQQLMLLEDKFNTPPQHGKIFKKSLQERSSAKQSSTSGRSKLCVVSNTVSPDSSLLIQSRRSEVLSESPSWLFPAVMDDKKSDPLQALINDKYLAHCPQTVVFDHQKDELECGRQILTQRPKTSHSKRHSPLEIFLAGPYGAPASGLFYRQVDHAVLIATGIGVTPFASILQSIMFKFGESRKRCPNCNYSWTNGVHDLMNGDFNLKKVDFFWINREQKAFEWFLQLLSQLEMEQAEEYEGQLKDLSKNFLDIHLYITSFSPNKDINAMALKLALDLMHLKEKRDLITGLKTRTNAGRPDWDKVFHQIKAQGHNRVTVFYCGNPNVSDQISQKCDEFGFTFKKEIF